MVENDDDGMVKTRVEEEDSNMRQQDEMNSKNFSIQVKNANKNTNKNAYKIT